MSNVMLFINLHNNNQSKYPNFEAKCFFLFLQSLKSCHDVVVNISGTMLYCTVVGGLGHGPVEMLMLSMLMLLLVLMLMLSVALLLLMVVVLVVLVGRGLLNVVCCCMVLILCLMLCGSDDLCVVCGSDDPARPFLPSTPILSAKNVDGRGREKMDQLSKKLTAGQKIDNWSTPSTTLRPNLRGCPHKKFRTFVLFRVIFVKKYELLLGTVTSLF